jgi:mitochondrial fission protein ELM1
VNETATKMRGAPRAVVVWWFRGRLSPYEDQTHSLLKALEAYCPLRVYAAPVVGSWRLWRALLLRRYPAADLPSPDILIGAGRETRWPMLVARWARGGRIITLSNPSRPRWGFDLCIAPAHDGARASSRMIATRGLLPPPSEPCAKIAATGLMVVGGPALHYRWSDVELMNQIAAVLSRHPDYRWYLITTERTLAETEHRLRELAGPNVFFIPHHEVDPRWLDKRIRDAEQVWLSEDNLNMIYRALTAGAAIGVFTIACRKPDLEVAALDGLVVFFSAWLAGQSLRAPQAPFNESARCATEIYQRWLSNVA